MIIVQDRIEVGAADRARVARRLLDEYAPRAAKRGLSLIELSSSPPLQLVDQPVSIYVRWSVADVAAWWAMRGASGEPDNVAFWRSLDALIVSRERRYLVPEPRGTGHGDAPTRAPEASWPAPIDLTPHRVATRGWRETVQVHLPASATPTEIASLRDALASASRALPGIEQTCVAANFVADFGAGHLTWDLRFADRASADAARGSEVWRNGIAPMLGERCARWTALGLETVGAGRTRPKLSQGVKRTALFRALPDAALALLDRWERDLLEMPAHVTSILNWRLARAVVLDWSSADTPRWTHVWEQEFAALEGLTIDYMIHPHHWAHVDRWFDPESGRQIIDTALCHAFSPLESSILSGDMG